MPIQYMVLDGPSPRSTACRSQSCSQGQPCRSLSAESRPYQNFGKQIFYPNFVRAERRTLLKHTNKSWLRKKSVTRWSDCEFNIWSFPEMKIYPTAKKLTQVGSVLCNKIAKKFKILPKWGNFAKSGSTASTEKKGMMIKRNWDTISRLNQKPIS